MKSPTIDKITTEDLQDSQRLKEIYVQAVTRKWWPNNDLSALEFFMYAEKALHDDKQGTPAKLFYYLIKSKGNNNISQAMEDTAIKRLPSCERVDLVDWAAGRTGGNSLAKSNKLQYEIFGEKKNIGFLHSVMVQCFLPQKPLPNKIRRFVSTHGKTSLVVEAGILGNPETTEEFKECVVPYGSQARLILPWINRFALQHKTREIDMGDSMRSFMERVKFPIGGYNGKKITENVEAIGAAQFILGEWTEGGASTKYGRIAQEISFWMERDPKQKIIWTPTMTLSEAYYDVLNSRPTPIDLDHLAQLTKSPQAMDIYSWLAYRLPMIRNGKTVRVPLRNLWKIFGRDINDQDKFTQTFTRNLKAVKKIYNGFDASVERGLLLLRDSPPPVAPRNLVLFPVKV